MMLPLPFFFTLKVQLIFWGGLLAAMGIVFPALDADLLISRLFYLGDGDWVGDARHFDLVYTYVPLLAIFSGVVCLAALPSIPLFQDRAMLWRICLSYLVALIGGVGLLANFLIKDLFQRPRPNDTIPFDGDFEFVLPFIFGPGGESFTSGHAASGFVLTFFFYVFYRLGHQRAAYAAYALGLFMGALLSYVRIAQGGHFLSDTLGSLCITQLVNALAARMLFSPKSSSALSFRLRPLSTLLRVQLWSASTIVLTLGAVGYLASTPYKHWVREYLPIPAKAQMLLIDLEGVEERVVLEKIKEDKTGFDYLHHGRGLPWSDFQIDAELLHEDEGRAVRFTYHVIRNRFPPGYDARISIYIPENMPYSVINPDNLPITGP